MSAAAKVNYRSIPTTEAAKLIRARLKKAYPDHKFSVRSNKYAGGSSIEVFVNVKREDNPELWTKVDAELDGFSGKSFDGMIDMSFYRHSWLNPDGSASLADHPGTTGSGGVYEPVDNPPPFPDSERVYFHSDYVRLSYDWTAK